MKAFWNILIGAFCVVMFLGIVGGNMAYGQCRSNVGTKADDDSAGPGLICTTGEYDPCDNWVWWTFDFSRTSESGSPSLLAMAILGTGIAWGADASLYPANGDYHQDSVWWINVGPSTEHELRVTLNGSSGYWRAIETTATYKAKQGS